MHSSITNAFGRFKFVAMVAPPPFMPDQVSRPCYTSFITHEMLSVISRPAEKCESTSGSPQPAGSATGSLAGYSSLLYIKSICWVL